LISTDNAPLRIDTHAHVFHRDLPMSAGRRHTPDHDALPESYLAALDSAGVTHALLTAPSFLGTDNSYLIETLHRFPERLRGVAIVEPDIPTDTLEAMDRAGIVGIRLNIFRFSTWPDLASPDYRRLLRWIADHDWHVEVYAESEKLDRLLPALTGSGAKIVLDHFGSPDPTLGIASPGYRKVLRAIAGGRTWVKLSGPYRLEGADPKTCAQALLEHGGAGQLVWGSDWPWTQHQEGKTYQGVFSLLRDWVADDTAYQKIVCDNPAKLFGFV
jgi:predicted TIM-barrel fold metal-dependent hydrolase